MSSLAYHGCQRAFSFGVIHKITSHFEGKKIFFRLSVLTARSSRKKNRTSGTQGIAGYVIVHSFEFVVFRKPRAISIICTPYLTLNPVAVKG